MNRDTSAGRALFGRRPNADRRSAPHLVVRNRLAVGCGLSNHTGVVEEMDGLPVSKKLLPNQPGFRSLPLPPAAIFNDHQRIDSLLSRLSPNVSGGGKPILRRARIPLNHNDQPAQACTTDSVCTGWVRVAGSLKWEVVESLRNRADRGRVMACTTWMDRSCCIYCGG